MGGTRRGMASVGSRARERDSETDALERASRDETVGDGGDRGLLIVRIGIDVHRLETDARLPLGDRTLNAIANELPRRCGIRLEQETLKTATELGLAQP